MDGLICLCISVYHKLLNDGLQILVVIDWSFDIDLVRTSKSLNQWLVASAVTSENNGRSKSAEERISVLLSAGDPIS